MAQTFRNEGETLSLTAPSGGVVSGTGYAIGGIFGVAGKTAAEGVSFPLQTEGVHVLAKVGSQAWTEGQRVYWNGTAASSVATVGQFIGVATEAVGSGAGETTGKVKLLGNAPAFLEGDQGTLADLTDNGGGATADGTIGAVTLPDLSAWNGSTDPSAAQATAIRAAITALTDAVKELSSKQNALLAILRIQGLIN